MPPLPTRLNLWCPPSSPRPRSCRLFPLVLLLLGVGIATVPPPGQAQESSPPPAGSPADSAAVRAEGRVLDRQSGQLFFYRIRADSTVYVRRDQPERSQALILPAQIVTLIHQQADRKLSTSDETNEFVGVGYKDDNLVLRVSQRFNLYILISLIVVVVVGGGLLAWLWWRLSRERRRRKALIQSRRYLTEGREKERERLAQEIHDGPVQALHGLHMQITALPDAPDLDEIGDELMRVTSELRAMSANLHPPALQRFGLAAAIRSHADRLRNRHGSLQIDMDLAEDCAPVPDEYELSLFRVAQEAMNNAVQHGEAAYVHVTLRCRDGTVTLDVRDDGTGFTPPDDWHALARQDHYGLLGMRERAEAINATLDIESAPERGTHVQLQGTLEAFEAPDGAEDPVPVPA